MKLREVPTSRESCEKWGTLASAQIIRTGHAALLEGLDGSGFVVFHVEDGIELGDLQ